MVTTFDDLKAIAIELQSEFEKFEKFEHRKKWTRETILQGFMVDVGDLTRACMALDGYRELKGAKRKLSHEFADCLWSLLVLADQYNVDLEAEYLATIKDLKQIIKQKVTNE